MQARAPDVQEGIDVNMSRRSTVIGLAVSTLIALAAALPAPAFAQEDLTAEQYDALSHALDMSIEDIRALDLSPNELQVLVDGFTEETVVVGSRGQPRTVAASSVPVDVLSTSDLTNQGVVNLQDQLRTVIPSFNVNTQPISDASTIVRPAMLRNLAPDHTLVLVNGKRRHRASIIDWHGGNGVAYGSQGADISAIPSIALRQVEVLRDGAAAQYGSDAIAGVMNFQLKDAASGGSLEFNTGTFQEGDGEAFNVAGNVGLPLGATGFANLSLEYGSSNPTNRSAPRSDAIALLAAGNTHVASDTPQIWGSPEVDDDLKLFGNVGYTWATGVQAYAHTNYASKRVTGGFFFRNPNTRGGVFSPDGGGTLLVGDRLWAETGTAGAGNCPTVPIAGNVPDAGALASVAANPSCFTLYERFPGGFTPRFGGKAQDMSVVGGVRGLPTPASTGTPASRWAPTRPTSSSATRSTPHSARTRRPLSISAATGSRRSALTLMSPTPPRTGSTWRPAPSGATSSTRPPRATRRRGESGRTAGDRVSRPARTGSSATARWPRAPGTAATSQRTATSKPTPWTATGPWAARCESNASRISGRRPTARSPPASPSCARA